MSSPSSIRSLPLVPACSAWALAWALAACQSTATPEVVSAQDVTAAPAPAVQEAPAEPAKPAQDPAAKAREAQAKAEKRERELRYARMELAIAELEVASETKEQEAGLREAERKLDEARLARDQYQGFEMPQKLNGARLNLDRAFHRRELAQDELKELEAMYAAEEFAELTKELVLKRGRKELEFANRSLESEEKAFANLRDVDLMKQKREQEAKVVELENALMAARRKAERSKLSGDLKLEKARDKIKDLEKPEPEGEAKPEAKPEEGEAKPEAKPETKSTGGVKS